MNKIAFCLSGILVLISFSSLLIISILGSIPDLYGNIYLTFKSANYGITIILSIVGIISGLYLCNKFYKKESSCNK